MTKCTFPISSAAKLRLDLCYVLYNGAYRSCHRWKSTAESSTYFPDNSKCLDKKHSNNSHVNDIKCIKQNLNLAESGVGDESTLEHLRIILYPEILGNLTAEKNDDALYRLTFASNVNDVLDILQRLITIA